MIAPCSRRVVQLDAAALLRVRASQVLAVAEGVFTAGVELNAEAPGTPDIKDGVALVRIDGPLAQRSYAELCGYVDGYDAITQRVTSALSDERVGSVVLVIDSPGGDAAGLEEAVTRINAAREASGKPVYAYIDELAASAAYWIAATVADKIYVPAMGAVGSIGCIGAIVDSSEAIAAQGLKVTLVRDPEGKAESHPAGVIGELAIERHTAVVSAYTTRFVTAVGESRGVDAEALRGLNGALVRGPDATKAKLADKVGTLEQTIQAAARAGVQAKRQRKKAEMSKAFRIELGLEDDAEDQQVLDTMRSRGVRAEFGDQVIKLTEAEGQEQALGRIQAWRDNAGAAEELAELRKQRAADAVANRLDSAIRSGKMTPAEAWTSDDDGLPLAGQPDPRWATWSEAQLSEYLELRPELTATAPAVEASPHALSDSEIAICKETGCDPGHFAQLKAARAAGQLRTLNDGR